MGSERGNVVMSSAVSDNKGKPASATKPKEVVQQVVQVQIVMPDDVERHRSERSVGSLSVGSLSVDRQRSDASSANNSKSDTDSKEGRNNSKEAAFTLFSSSSTVAKKSNSKDSAYRSALKKATESSSGEPVNPNLARLGSKQSGKKKASGD